MNPHKNFKAFYLHDCKLQSEGINALSSYLAQINPSKFEEIELSFVENIDVGNLALMLRDNTHLKILKFT
jgi:hypothetical protein